MHAPTGDEGADEPKKEDEEAAKDASHIKEEEVERAIKDEADREAATSEAANFEKKLDVRAPGMRLDDGGEDLVRHSLFCLLRRECNWC